MCIRDSFEALRRQQLVHARVQIGKLVESQLRYLRGGHVGGRVLRQRRRIIGGTVRKARYACVVTSLGQQRRQQVDLTRQRGADRPFEYCLRTCIIAGEAGGFGAARERGDDRLRCRIAVA